MPHVRAHNGLQGPCQSQAFCGNAGYRVSMPCWNFLYHLSCAPTEMAGMGRTLPGWTGSG